MELSIASHLSSFFLSFVSLHLFIPTRPTNSITVSRNIIRSYGETRLTPSWYQKKEKRDRICYLEVSYVYIYIYVHSYPEIWSKLPRPIRKGNHMKHAYIEGALQNPTKKLRMIVHQLASPKRTLEDNGVTGLDSAECKRVWDDDHFSVFPLPPHALR